MSDTRWRIATSLGDGFHYIHAPTEAESRERMARRLILTENEFIVSIERDDIEALGAVWVRADSGSPGEELMMCRNTIADLITKIDVLASELSRLFSTLAGGCAAKDETSSRDRP